MTRNDKNSQIVKYTGQIEARQLIFDLFARRAGREFDLPVLVHAGRPFGISEAAFRTALTRLKREGRVENLQRGRYRLKMPAALLQRVLGARGISILSRLTGLVLAALAAQMIMTGVQHYLGVQGL